MRTVLARATPFRIATRGADSTSAPAIATATPQFVEATVAVEFAPATRVVLAAPSAAIAIGTPVPRARTDAALAEIILPWLFAAQGALVLIGLVLFLRMKRGTMD